MYNHPEYMADYARTVKLRALKKKRIQLYIDMALTVFVFGLAVASISQW